MKDRVFHAGCVNLTYFGRHLSVITATFIAEKCHRKNVKLPYLWSGKALIFCPRFQQTLATR